ncbi:MAG: hypothetical protein GX945_16150 [Lentisphaerae bacterium]|nr:hypothetical protein [Lentisphaerota bacterium]
MVKRLRRNMDIMDTMDDNTRLPAVHTVHIVHIVHSSLREQQLSIGDRLPNGGEKSVRREGQAAKRQYTRERLCSCFWMLVESRAAWLVRRMSAAVLDYMA